MANNDALKRINAIVINYYMFHYDITRSDNDVSIEFTASVPSNLQVIISKLKREPDISSVKMKGTHIISITLGTLKWRTDMLLADSMQLIIDKYDVKTIVVLIHGDSKTIEAVIHNHADRFAKYDLTLQMQTYDTMMLVIAAEKGWHDYMLAAFSWLPTRIVDTNPILNISYATKLADIASDKVYYDKARLAIVLDAR